MAASLQSAVLAFGPLFSSAEQRETVAVGACERCKDRLGHTLGDEWMSCVTDDLLDLQKSAKSDGSRKYFPLEREEAKRLWPGGARFGRTDELANIMRNYSCEIADGGSRPVRSFQWTFHPSDPCDGGSSSHSGAGGDGDGGGGQRRFAHARGFLPAGNDLRSAQLTEAAAQDKCWADEKCAGFTFSFSGTEAERARVTHNVMFKSSAEGQSPAECALRASTAACARRVRSLSRRMCCPRVLSWRTAAGTAGASCTSSTAPRLRARGAPRHSISPCTSCASHRPST
jgi:hypothetical protein